MADPFARPLSTPRKPVAAAVPAVRLAQLVRTSAPTAPRAGDVVVELGTTRITIGAGADTATVVMVLTLLGGRS
jgi:hypothetical protein